MIVKICATHGELKESQIYVWQYKGRTYKRCHQCILAKNKRNQAKFYADPEKLQRKRDRDNARYKENRDAIVAKRQSEEGKAVRRKWYAENAERYREEYKAKQAKYRQNLDDPYITRLIRGNDKTMTGVEIPKAMIELKRLLINIRKKAKEANTKEKFNK